MTGYDLTEKTKLLFISSNSSFSECVRNSDMRQYHIPSVTPNDDCPSTPVTNREFKPIKCTYSSGSHSFIQCTWDNSERTSNGGAIHYRLTANTKDSSTSLTVDKCTFLHCKEADPIDGGAIYTAYIGTVSVSNSHFLDCKSGSGETGAEGGGVLCYFISVLPLIRSCTFLFCTTGDDGGGCGIWFSNSSLAYAVDSCRCIKCQGTHIDNSQGGGIMLAWNDMFITITNCLLSACETKYQGGGIWMSYPSGTSVRPLTFCFFSENKSGYGRDVQFINFPSDAEAITHSFSTEPSISGSVCVGTFNSETVVYSNIHPVNWLPQGIPSFFC